ncbi:MAG: hypothetical protein IJ355_01990 [Prevotella sp.]|nr:hypothetical protein [Prevotella sp.]
MMMTLEELRKRLSGRLHAADINELCRMAQDEDGDGMKAGLLGFAGDEDRRVASNALWTFSYFGAPARRWLQTRQAEVPEAPPRPSPRGGCLRDEGKSSNI